MEFRLPDIGEGLAEGEVIKWLVQEGQSLQEGDPLVEVMTDKATVEIPSPCSGRIDKLLVAEGQVVPIGTVLVIIGDGSSAPVPVPAAAAAVAVASVAPAPTAPAPSAPPPTAPAPTAPAPAAPVPAAAPTNGGRPDNGRQLAASSVGGKVLAAPATRRLARELGIDLVQVEGSGPRGRITKDDLSRFSQAAMAPQAPLALAASGPEEERIPLRGLRRLIANAMVHSKATAAHFSYVDEVDMTEVVALRRKLKPTAEQKDVRLTYLPFIIKATVSALRDFPILNAALDDQAQEIVIKRRYHIGIATNTEAGLLVPVVRDCDRRTMLDVARDINRLADGARAGTLKPDELRGSTFTITSAGNIGGLFATPIINHPEVAILGVNKIHQRPVVRDGEVVVRDMMYLSMSLDHRVVDGAVAAMFLNRVIELLQNPGLMLLESV